MSVTFTFFKDDCIGLRCDCREREFPGMEEMPFIDRPDEWFSFECVHNSFDFNVSNVNALSVLGGLRLMPATEESLVGHASPHFIAAQLESAFCPVPVRYKDSLRRLVKAAVECGYDIGWA